MRVMPAMVLLGATALTSCGSGGSATSATAMLAVLQQVDGALQRQGGTVNTAAADRVDDVKGKVDGLMKEAAGYGKDFNNATTDQREAFVTNAAGLIQQASRLTQNAGADLSGNLNKVLVSEAAALEAIPFARKMTPFVLGTDPLAVTDVSKPVDVRAYAFLPSDMNAEEVVAQINGVEISTKQFADNKIGFRIPANVLKPNQVNTYDIVFTEKHRFRKATTIRISGDIQANSPTPWSCAMTFAVKNPASQTQLTGTPVSTYADSGHSTIDRTYTPEELFAAMKLDPTKYDAKSARILSSNGAVTASSKPCACGNDPSALTVSETADGVRVNLFAPSTGYGRRCGHFLKSYICGGGGSNVTYTLNPVLGVDVIGEARTKPAATEIVRVGRNTTSTVPLKVKTWEQMSAVCTYQAGPLSFADRADLNFGRPNANSTSGNFLLSQDDNGLYVTTKY